MRIKTSLKNSGRRLVDSLENLIQRVVAIVAMLKIEFAELASILAALAWIIPLSFQPYFISVSSTMVAFNDRFPRPLCILVLSLLLFYQVVTLLLGGKPSLFIQNAENERLWLIARGVGVWFSVLIWAVMAILLTTGGVIVPASIWLSGVSLMCVGGVWKFDYLVKENAASQRIQQREGDPRLLNYCSKG